MMTMNWKRWKIGLLVAGLTGLLTAFVTGQIMTHMSTKEFLLILAVNVATHMLLFLKQHPVDSIELAAAPQVLNTSDKVGKIVTIIVLLVATAALAIAATGCSVISGERVAADGTRMRVQSWRCLWASEGVEFVEKDGVTLKMIRSKSDREAIAAAAEGAARGVAASGGAK